HCHILLFLCHLLPPTSTLFPYTTLFRSSRRRCVCTRRRGSSGGVPCAVIASVTRTFLLIRWWRSARTCCIAIRRTGPSPRSSSPGGFWTRRANVRASHIRTFHLAAAGGVALAAISRTGKHRRSSLRRSSHP